MSTFERPSAYDGCTSKPTFGVAIVWPIVCLEVAELGNSRMSALSLNKLLEPTRNY
jgi:hypothetical protein